MDPSNTDEQEALPPVVFGRSSKKRKIYRQRGAETSTADVAATEGSPPKAVEDEATSAQPRPVAARGKSGRIAPAKDDGGDESDSKADQNDGESEDGDRWNEEDEEDEGDAVGIAVAELIRRRKARKPKIGGVEFRDEDGQPSASSSTDRSLVASRYTDFDFDDMDLDFSGDPMAMGMQFVPQTGMIGELVNKHMEEYVDAQLAKRHQAEAAAQGIPQGAGQGGAGAGPGSGSGPSGAGASIEAREQLAMKGKLHEIDLGAEARARNVAMTERATQRLRGAGGDDANGGGGGLSEGGSGTERLGRDGKPLRRKRRASDDLKRDQMVEQFLHENRMDVDVYDVSREPAVPTTEGRPTDDRIAEQFRREFMEAVAQRMRRKRRPLGPPTKPKVRNEEEILRGPKLGGSRNVRSVMRDKLLQKQEEERHNMPKYEQQLQEQKRRANRRR